MFSRAAIINLLLGPGTVERQICHIRSTHLTEQAIRQKVMQDVRERSPELSDAQILERYGKEIERSVGYTMGFQAGWLDAWEKSMHS